MKEQLEEDKRFKNEELDEEYRHEILKEMQAGYDAGLTFVGTNEDDELEWIGTKSQWELRDKLLGS